MGESRGINMKNVLVRNGQHQRPIKAVFDRYGLGTKDKYNRGVWVSQADVQKAIEMMDSDPSFFICQGYKVVNGTNCHNHVTDYDLKELFEGVS